MDVVQLLKMGYLLVLGIAVFSYTSFEDKKKICIAGNIAIIASLTFLYIEHILIGNATFGSYLSILLFAFVGALPVDIRKITRKQISEAFNLAFAFLLAAIGIGVFLLSFMQFLQCNA